MNLSTGVSKLKNLTSIALRFATVDMTDTALVKISQDLQTLKNLISINLDFTSNKMLSEAGVKRLSQALSSFKELSSLILSFS